MLKAHVLKKFFMVTMVLSFVLMISACGKDSTTSTALPAPSQGASAKPADGSSTPAKLTNIRIAFLKTGGQTPQYVADKQGFFEKHGLKVERIEFRDAPKMVAAIQSGDLEIMASIPAPILAAREQNFNLVTFMQNETARSEAPDSGAILVGKDSGINSVKELKGKKIAILAKGSQDGLAALYVLKKAGVDLDSLTLIAAPFANHMDMLKSKQVDATFTVNPFTTQIIESGVGKPLAYHLIETAPEQPLGAWWANPDWVKKNPETVEAFGLAIKDAIDYLKADEKRAQGIVAEYTGLDIKLLEKMPAINWNYNVNLDSWNKINKILLEMGALTKMPNPDEFMAENMKKYIVSK